MANDQAVAVVGLAGRFPGAPDVATFWRNLRDGVESITFLSEAELAKAGIPADVARDPSYIPARGVLGDSEGFDASFFGMTPREADGTDPQHRLFLECAYAALEDAGFDPHRVDGLIGVFAGSGSSRHRPAQGAGDPVADYQWAIGHEKDFLTTRVSYKLNLRGPSLTLQTACSTSLVAVCTAYQNLLSYQCDVALAGGVSIGRRAGYVFRDGMILSPDGHCRAFDAAAAGTVPGDGVGVVVLKRLGDALADGDTVHAVIRGCAVNNDGGEKVGYTAPRVQGQAEVIAQALALAEVEADTVGYVEAHGTATPLGDVVEMAALTQAFREGTERTGFCAIGSVKTNIGHLDAASGIAALIKTVLSLEHGEIPPSLHWQAPNPKIDFDGSPFFVNAELRPWPATDRRRAGVSSFGIGGTNAHVVLEEAPAVTAPEPSGRPQIVVLSAAGPMALDRRASDLAGHLAARPHVSLADVASTLQVGRAELPHRRFLVARHVDEAAGALSQPQPRPAPPTGEERPVTFLFPGQGVKDVAMVSALYTEEPVFRTAVDRSVEFLRSEEGLDISGLVCSPPAADSAGDLWAQTDLAQPALFVLEHALAELLGARFGIYPAAVFGHSLGEYAAACLAGVLSVDDALRLVAGRGKLMQTTTPGAMLAVRLPEAEVRELLDSNLALAAVNSPSDCVVAGPLRDVEALELRLADQENPAKRLSTRFAFHSALMDEVLDRFGQLVRDVELRAPRLPYVSSLTGRWATAEEVTDPGYWVRQLRQTVRFDAGLEELFGRPNHVLLEVGPGATLSTLARRHPRRPEEQLVLATLSGARERSAAVGVLETLGTLWCAGVRVEWPRLHEDERRRRVSLPTYPFERPTASAPVRPSGDGSPSPHVKKPDPADWFYTPTWQAAPTPTPDPAPPRRWMVLANADGVGDRLATRLGPGTVTVRTGDGFASLGEDVFTVHPARRGDYEALLAELARRNQLPDGIGHLWTMDPGAGETLAALEQSLEQGFSSLLCLAQAWGAQPGDRPLRLFVITNETQSLGRAARHPEQATMLGPCRVIPDEYPNISCTNVDVGGDVARDGGLDRLAAELGGEPTERLVVLRDEGRFVARYAPLPLPAAARPHPRLRPGGVYLITGGLGGLGLVLAGYLARAAGAKLILTGRHGLSPETAPTNGEADEEARQRAAQVAELERAGAEVLVRAADVTDLAQMQAVVAEARSRFGAIHGVVHAAGLTTGGVIQRKTLDDAAQILSPKVRGTLVLETALQGETLDFFVLCSSLTAVVGGFGQADYCAANCFLDAYAQQQAALGRPVTSVNWDGWQEVGAAARAARTQRRRPHPLLESRAAPDGTRIARLSERQWVIAEHRVDGRPTLPGTAYLELACAAALERGWSFPIRIPELLLLEPLIVPPGEEIEAHLIAEEDADGLDVRLSSCREGRWRTHMTCRVTPDANPSSTPTRRLEVTNVAHDYPEFLSGPPPKGAGIEVGARWACLQWVRRAGDSLLGSLELADEFVSGDRGFTLHPALLDVATGLFEADGLPYLPFSYCDVVIHEPLPRRLYSRVTQAHHAGALSPTRRARVLVAAPDGRPVFTVGEYVLKLRKGNDGGG